MSNDAILDRIFMITERMIIFDGLDDVFEHIVKTAVALTHAEAATIRVFDMQTGALNIVKGYGVTNGFLTQPPIRVGEGITGNVVQTGEPFSTDDVTRESNCKNSELAQLEGIRSAICVPMKTRDANIGCITVYRKRQEPFSEHDMLLLSIFSSEAVQAIEKARLISELKKQATLDPLTGLYNKRTSLDKLNMEVDRTRRHHQPMAVMFIDLDGFKQFNDTHGHLLGDKLIHDFTQILRDQCRKIDIMGRFGGDEFLIIAPQTSLEGARALGNKLCHATSQHDFLSSEPQADFHTTCSIGIALAPVHGDHAEALLSRADAALYESKRRGRNCATIWSEEISTQTSNPQPQAAL